MGAESVVRGQLLRNLRGEFRGQATSDVNHRQLQMLGLGFSQKFVALSRKIGSLGIGLRTD